MSAAPTNGKSSITLGLMILGMIGALVMTLLNANSQFSEVRSEQATSRAERTDLKIASERHTAATAENREAIVRIQSDLIEAETQQRANSQIRNLMIAHEQQLMAILWEEVKKSPMPKDGYYPDISLPKPGK